MNTRPTGRMDRARTFTSAEDAEAAKKLVTHPGTDFYINDYKTRRYRVFVWRAVGKDFPRPGLNPPEVQQRIAFPADDQ